MKLTISVNEKCPEPVALVANERKCPSVILKIERKLVLLI